jgi:hypothetical protein
LEGKDMNAEASNFLELRNAMNRVIPSDGCGVAVVAGGIPAEDELDWTRVLLEAQVDTALDGILVVDCHGKKFSKTSGIAHSGKSPRTSPKIILNSFNSSRSGRKILMNSSRKCPTLPLYHPNELIRDEFEWVDGTVLDRYLSPVRDKAGKYYGRIRAFRDITKRDAQRGVVLNQQNRFVAAVDGDRR